MTRSTYSLWLIPSLPAHRFTKSRVCGVNLSWTRIFPLDGRPGECFCGAFFPVGATNWPDQVDSAILSRFAEQIEFPLPDETVRQALLELFLGPMHFTGDRQGVICSLVWATDGMSGATSVTSLIKPSYPPSNVRVFHKTFRCSK
jgi:hypothetical protein